MKKLIKYWLAGLVLSFGLISNSQAVLLLDGTDVGAVDDYLTVTDTLQNSSPTTEEEFVDEYLLSIGLDPVDFITKLDNDVAIVDTQTTDVYAADITTDLTAVADYFIVKNSTYWALFENLVDFDWAVFDASLLPAEMNIPGDFTVSHITLFDGTANVPEPTSLALLALGLLGLGFSRRRS